MTKCILSRRSLEWWWQYFFRPVFLATWLRHRELFLVMPVHRQFSQYGDPLIAEHCLQLEQAKALVLSILQAQVWLNELVDACPTHANDSACNSEPFLLNKCKRKRFAKCAVEELFELQIVHSTCRILSRFLKLALHVSILEDGLPIMTPATKSKPERTA